MEAFFCFLLTAKICLYQQLKLDPSENTFYDSLEKVRIRPTSKEVRGRRLLHSSTAGTTNELLHRDTLFSFLVPCCHFRVPFPPQRPRLTCWLWTLWVSGQRRSPEPRHTGRRASHWGCSSGSCRRFLSCRLQTRSAWCTRASVFSPPWWKGLRKGE